MPATVSADVDKPIPARPAAPRPRRARRPRDHGRWLREARGIVAMAVAGFAVVSLAVFDPALHPTEQGTSVGPVGAWLGWALFRSLGYAGFLLPLLLAAWGLSAFTRPRLARGWVPLAGIAVLVLAAAGLMQQSAETFVAQRVTRGGILATGGWVGWALTSGLSSTLGQVGTWLLLLAAVPVGVLLVTQASYAGHRPTRHGAPGPAAQAARAPGPRRRVWSPSSRRRRSWPSRTPRSSWPCRTSWSRACRAAG